MVHVNVHVLVILNGINQKANLKNIFVLPVWVGRSVGIFFFNFSNWIHIKLSGILRCH